MIFWHQIIRVKTECSPHAKLWLLIFTDGSNMISIPLSRWPHHPNKSLFTSALPFFRQSRLPVTHIFETLRFIKSAAVLTCFNHSLGFDLESANEDVDQIKMNFWYQPLKSHTAKPSPSAREVPHFTRRRPAPRRWYSGSTVNRSKARD